MDVAPDTLTIPELVLELDPASSASSLQMVLAISMGLGRDGEGVAWFDVDPGVHWGGTSVHGGALPPLVDIAGAICVAHTFPDAMTAIDATIELKLNYLRRAREGRVTAVARMVHRGRRVAVSDVNVINADTLCAKGLVTYMLNPNAHGRPDPET